MNRGRRSRQRVPLLAAASFAACILSCTPYRTGTRSVLRADHPRGPGSFCALNPEGCPPPAPVSTPPAEPGTFDLETCLKACEAGGAILESYCRSLPENWQQRLCWSVVLAKKTVCKGMCYRLNACASGADCPEREE